MDEALLALIALVKSAAPELWRIALAQVAVEADAKKVWAIFLVVIASIFLVLVVLSFLGTCHDPDYAVSFLFAVVFFLLTTAGTIMLFVRHHMMTINPEYYAIQIILSLVGLGGI